MWFAGCLGDSASCKPARWGEAVPGRPCLPWNPLWHRSIIPLGSPRAQAAHPREVKTAGTQAPWRPGSALNRSGPLHLDARLHPERRRSVVLPLTGKGGTGSGCGGTNEARRAVKGVVKRDVEGYWSPLWWLTCSNGWLYIYIYLDHKNILVINGQHDWFVIVWNLFASFRDR